MVMATQLSWLEHITHNDGVTGSNPVVATIPNCFLLLSLKQSGIDAVVAELVDAPDLGSGAVRCESSSLSDRTIINRTQLLLGFVLSDVSNYSLPIDTNNHHLNTPKINDLNFAVTHIKKSSPKTGFRINHDNLIQDQPSKLNAEFGACFA